MNAAFALDLRISNLCESVYQGFHECGWKLVRTESRRDCLQSEFLCEVGKNSTQVARATRQKFDFVTTVLL